MVVLCIILVRFLLLLFNIDIIPLNVKKAINHTFSCNPEEITAYIFSPIITKLRRYDYDTVLNNQKD